MTTLQEQIEKLEAANKVLREACEFTHSNASPGASRNEWLCFRECKQALQKAARIL